jgi:hypothetical protein
MPHGRRQGKLAGRFTMPAVRTGELWVALVLDCATNINEIVGNHPEPDPALHADFAPISTTVETMPPLGDADAAFASSPPFLAIAEPTLLRRTGLADTNGFERADVGFGSKDSLIRRGWCLSTRRRSPRIWSVSGPLPARRAAGQSCSARRMENHHLHRRLAP